MLDYKFTKLAIIALFVIFLGIYISLMPKQNTGKSILQTQKIGASSSAVPGPANLLDNKSEFKNTVMVTKVIDGDTIEIEGGQRVRYIGIDTPETVHPNIKVQCFGERSSDFNKELVEGKEVRLEKDVSEEDKYGRLLRYVYLGDIFINDLLVREGFASASSYPPDVKFQSELQNAQVEAAKNNKGIWSECGVSQNVTSNGDGCIIKGNITNNGEKIYHTPGQKYYTKTVIDEAKNEKWFCNEEDAQEAGFRKSKI